MMQHFAGIRAVIAALLIAFAAASARAQQAPLQDKPFAEHKIVLQLSDNDPRKQGMVISVANNLMKFYDPDKVAVEIVAFGPGIDLLKPDNPNPQAGREPGGAGRAGRYLPQHRRHAGTRDRQAAGIHSAAARRSRSASHRFCFLPKMVTHWSGRECRHCERSEAIHRSAAKKEWIASSLRSSQ